MLTSLMFDTVTIAPYSGTDVSHKDTYGTPVVYENAQVLPFVERTIDKNGHEFVSAARIVIPGRVAIDTRSLLTLPAGFVPQTPAIRVVRPLKGLGLDHTEILC